jgi:hypothetical protein
MLIGFCKDLPEAWNESIVVHERMAIPLPVTQESNGFRSVECQQENSANFCTACER